MRPRPNAWAGLLRAVNVGGTGKLAMADLRTLCTACGFRGARTYIASGNVVFDADGDEARIKSALQAALHAHAGRALDVHVRSGAEMIATLAANPFPGADPARTVAIFLDKPPPADLGVKTRADEAIVALGREIWVLYPSGQGRSKLRIAAAAAGTARNLNTVRTLADWASTL